MLGNALTYLERAPITRREDATRLALQRALIELEFAHAMLGNNRALTRAHTIDQARRTLAAYRD